jgi:hypothetical protein
VAFNLYPDVVREGETFYIAIYYHCANKKNLCCQTYCKRDELDGRGVNGVPISLNELTILAERGLKSMTHTPLLRAAILKKIVADPYNDGYLFRYVIEANYARKVYPGLVRDGEHIIIEVECNGDGDNIKYESDAVCNRDDTGISSRNACIVIKNHELKELVKRGIEARKAGIM